MSEWDEQRRAYRDAADWFVAITATVADWGATALGEWTVRDLVGHTSRALSTVEEYLNRPCDRVDVPSAAAYYVATRDIAARPEVAERGRDAGRALGDDPAEATAAIASRVVPLLEDVAGDAVVGTVAGGMRLSDYLPTRTFELTVHPLALAAATGLHTQPPARPARVTLALVSELAIDTGLAGSLLLASTGRTPLPPGYSVLDGPPSA